MPRAIARTIRPDSPRRTSVNRLIVPMPPVYGARRDETLDAVKVLVQSVHGFADVYSPGSQTPRRYGIAYAGFPPCHTSSTSSE